MHDPDLALLVATKEWNNAVTPRQFAAMGRAEWDTYSPETEFDAHFLHRASMPLEWLTFVALAVHESPIIQWYNRLYAALSTLPSIAKVIGDLEWETLPYPGDDFPDFDIADCEYLVSLIGQLVMVYLFGFNAENAAEALYGFARREHDQSDADEVMSRIQDAERAAEDSEARVSDVLKQVRDMSDTAQAAWFRSNGITSAVKRSTRDDDDDYDYAHGDDSDSEATAVRVIGTLQTARTAVSALIRSPVVRKRTLRQHTEATRFTHTVLKGRSLPLPTPYTPDADPGAPAFTFAPRRQR